MESLTKISEKTILEKPTLIVGVPGIGFVANVVAKHMIRSLNAIKMGEIYSPFFQDISNGTISGGVESPILELYYRKSKNLNDLIILYGNTQSLTTYGQYELSGKILDAAQSLGCGLVASIGGLRKDIVSKEPMVYCTATDFGTLDQLKKHGLKTIQGQVFGISGILVGLAKLRDIKGFCLLAETTGAYTDVAAAMSVLIALNDTLGLNIDQKDIEKSAGEVSKTFNMLKDLKTEKGDNSSLV